MFREKTNCTTLYTSYFYKLTVAMNARFNRQLPNVNSLVGNPDAESAATTADGPGTGITGMLLSTHNFAYIPIPKER